jgi:hypothetical protein
MSNNSIAIQYSQPQMATTAVFICMFVCMILSVAIGSPAIAQTVATEVTDSDPISDYLDAIETAEEERSAYSTELSDLYLGLG